MSERPISRGAVTVAPADLPARVLADAPSAWRVQVPLGQVLIIYADGYGREDDQLVYDVLLDGRPPELFDVVSGPLEFLDDVYSEEPEHLHANEFDWSAATGTELTAVPDVWHVGIAGGYELIVHANDVQERDGEHVFTLTVRGGGPGLPVLQVSDSLVTSIRRT